jgi:hypothetical protein
VWSNFSIHPSSYEGLDILINHASGAAVLGIGADRQKKYLTLEDQQIQIRLRLQPQELVLKLAG